jgi:hypothetical protein
MKIRTMERIETGFRYPADAKAAYSGPTLECNVVADMKDDEAEMLIAAGIAESKETKEAVATTKGKG